MNIDEFYRVYRDHPIDKDGIYRAVVARAAGQKAPARRRLPLRPLLACTAALLLLGAGLSGYALAEQAREYEEAVAFFGEHNLPTDGLSRSEIRRVYRDIATGSFSYGKTAEVIEKTVPGYEIMQDRPAPGELEALWKRVGGRLSEGIDYALSYTERFDETLGFNVHDKSVFTKYIDGEEAWSVDFEGVVAEGYAASDGLIAVYGRTPAHSSEQISRACLALLDENGAVLWDTVLWNGFQHEYVAKVLFLENELAVFSRGDLAYLCLSRYAMDGERAAFAENKVGNYGIWNAARLGDGFIVQLGNRSTDGEFLVKVAADGTLAQTFAYTSESEVYFITDMLEYRGEIYLSAYAVPTLAQGEGDAGGRYDIAAVLNEIFENEEFDITGEELAGRLRENFTAVLLACDPGTGVPREFYSIKGAFGGKLFLGDEGDLLWDVESIAEAELSLATSAYTIRGACRVYRCAFDGTGALLSRETTGEVVGFWR